MGYSRKDIMGTSPLDYKNMNDNFKYLWLKTFGNIVDADLASDANINGAKIKAKSVTADQIDVTTLYVGTGGISLDPSATISWGQITDEPAIIDENTVTTITNNSISTATIRANQISGGTITGVTLQTAASGARVVLNAQDIGCFLNDTNAIKIGYWGVGTYPYIQFTNSNGTAQIYKTGYDLMIQASSSPTRYIALSASNGLFDIRTDGSIVFTGYSMSFNSSPVLTQATGVTAKFA